MRKIYFLWIAMMSVGASALSQEIDYKGFPEWSWRKHDSTEYLLYTPSDLKKGERYPVALFLHGCCGKDNHATMRNAVDPPVRMWHHFGDNTQDVPTYVIAPATSRGWSQHIENLKFVIDSLINKGNADPTRIYITGFSMGGAGTIEFLQRYPKYFAAALPMGMNFRGDMSAIKDIPIWTNRGALDKYANKLNNSVAEIRAMNGDLNDSSEYNTGVNPRFTSFEGVGHNVQWLAASTQDLTGWAYSKINDGNIYPVVFFRTPTYNQAFTSDKIQVGVDAHDPDGNIEKVVIKVNGKIATTFTRAPYEGLITTPKGDATIEAIAYDNKGKSSVATTLIKKKSPGEVIVTEIKTARGKELTSTKVKKGAAAHIDRTDGEVTISNTSNYDGFTLIQTESADTTRANQPYLSFTVDEPVTVYVAYETLDNRFHSTIPAWLRDYKKQSTPQIVTQYFYYDVYSKDFPKGKIELPGGGIKAQNVNTNYFVLLKTDQRK